MNRVTPRRTRTAWWRLGIAVAVVGAVAVPGAVLASHSFTDVPDAHTFHADVAWLAETGVTKGCNPPANTEFCPGDYVTRGQMAAFLHRLAINQVVDAADSDLLDGKDGPGVAYEKNDSGTTVPSTVSVLQSAEITAPQDGYVIAEAYSQISSSHTTGTLDDARLSLAAQTNDWDADGIQRNVGFPAALPTDFYSTIWSEQKVYPVEAGSHVFYVLGVLNSGSLEYSSTTLTLLWVPAAYGNVNTDPSSGAG